MPTRSDGRGAVLAERGEVPTRGRHNSSVPTRSDGRDAVLAESGESLPGAVTIRPCPPGAKEGVGQLQELERSLNRGHHGLFLPNCTEVNTSRSPDIWKEPTCSMEPNEGWRSQELRSTLQRRTNIPAQICRVVELPSYCKIDYAQCMSPIYELCILYGCAQMAVISLNHYNQF